MNAIKKYNWNSKVAFRATTTSQPLSGLKDTVLRVTSCAIAEEIGPEGFLQKVGYLMDVNEEIYGTISRSAIQAIDSLIDLMQDLKTVVCVKISSSKSSSGNEYVTITLAE